MSPSSLGALIACGSGLPTYNRYVSRLAGTPQTPERTTQQRLEALQRANSIRTRRAQLKDSLRLGHVSIDDVLEDPPEYLYTAKVFDLLMAVPKFGLVRTNRVLERCRVSPSKTVAGLTPRQRRELVDQLKA
jgi:hypothetical protein